MNPAGKFKQPLTNGKSIASKHKISDLEAELGISQFIRVHRSYIVNRDKITAYTAEDVEVGGVEMPIGVLYKHRWRNLERSVNTSNKYKNYALFPL